MDVTQMVRQAAPVGYPPAARGYIAPTKPAPQSFNEGVFVVLPEASTEHLYGPCKWVRQGGALPAPGAACVVAFDEQHFPTVVWWEGGGTQLVSTLPASPVDGQEVYYQNAAMATAGVVWHLRYRAASASTHKWELVGGAPLFAEVAANQETKSGTFVELGGPALTAPLAGDYDISFGGRIEPQKADFAIVGLYVAGVATPALLVIGEAVGANNQGTVERARREASIAASAEVALRYRCNGGVGASFEQRTLQLRPVRVG